MDTLLHRLDKLPKHRKMAVSALVCVTTTVLAMPLHEVLDLANIVMLFLLTVLLIAVSLGRSPAVLAAFLSVLLFDVFFVPPRFSLAVHDAQYLVTFAVMLAVALVTAHLAAGLRREAQLSAQKERQTRALYEVARELAGTLTCEQVADIARRFLNDTFAIDALLLLPGKDGALVPSAGGDASSADDMRAARLAFESGTVVDGESGRCACFPLKAPMRVRGVLLVRTRDAGDDSVHAQRSALESCASLLAIAVERLHYVEVANSSQVEMASERLRSSILSALSHDLRTPLTALVGLADSLTLVKPPLAEPAMDTALALRDQAARMNSLVSNLLDMARLHAGELKLRLEWQPVEEAIGAAINLLRPSLGNRPVHVAIAHDMPLLRLDAVLMERVYCNLIENAAKYSPAGSAIDIAASARNGIAEITVCDRGSGFPADKASVFGMFVRGTSPGKPGVGLGLAICRAIVESHGGSIAAENREGGGACVRLALPVGDPPAIDDELIARGRP